MNFVLIISLLSLSSCISFKGAPKEITKLNNKSVSDPALNIDYPDPVNMKDMDFIIITPDNATKTFAQLLADDVDPALWCLADDDYHTSSKNHDAVQGYIVVLYKTLQKYKEQYDKESEPDVGHD